MLLLEPFAAMRAAARCGAAQALAYLFPRDAQTFQDAAQQAAESRIWAGIHFRSDVIAGVALGQKVGSKVVERAKVDGAQ